MAKAPPIDHFPPNEQDVEGFTQFLHGNCYEPGSVQAAIDHSTAIRQLMEHNATIHAHAVGVHVDSLAKSRATPAQTREVKVLQSLLDRLEEKKAREQEALVAKLLAENAALEKEKKEREKEALLADVLAKNAALEAEQESPEF